MYLKLDIINNLGLFFRTRRCMCVHPLGVQNHAKLEKRVCFCLFCKFGKAHDGKIQEKNMQKCIILRVYFNIWKNMLTVCFASPLTRMISTPKQKCPRSGCNHRCRDPWLQLLCGVTLSFKLSQV